MSIPTVNSQEFHEAFTGKDYPALVRIADNFAQSLAVDAAHDSKLLSKLDTANLLNQQQDEHERNTTNIYE